MVGNKLYVGEEDSMDDRLDNDGYVSIWDISDRTSPKFLKRLNLGKELPEDYKMTHELYSTMNGRYVYAQLGLGPSRQDRRVHGRGAGTAPRQFRPGFAQVTFRFLGLQKGS
ncbi:MAG: hypothetical protein ACREYE_00610 [Gammaproteobacteria bacterium]